jgi:hypothetical protein
MPALSPVKKESVGLGGSRMGKKGYKIAKAEIPCSWECYEKTEIFFLEIMIQR